MSQTDTFLAVPAIGSNRTLSGSLAVLIEVPEVKVRRIKRAGPAVLPRSRNQRPRLGRPRRRLRRQVRLAGCALLALSPLVFLCTLGWSSRPSRILACSISDASEPDSDTPGFADPQGASSQGAVQARSLIGSAGVVTLSIEPAAATPGAEARVPVFFPGYVLPDDGFEDRAHAGS